jgi:hypothetical protein
MVMTILSLIRGLKNLLALADLGSSFYTHSWRVPTFYPSDLPLIRVEL